MISQAAWRKYIDKLAAIDKKAAAEMQAWIDKHGLRDEEALIRHAYALATKYGEASAALSANTYDEMAEMMDADVPAAVPAETATLDEVRKGTLWGKYHSPSQIPSIIGRQSRQAGADTMIQNAKRDHAQWAWVPQGDSCAFCITLASNGWQEASETVLKGNHAKHIHQNCDCTFAIAFKEEDKRQYDYIYDPDKYLEMYDEAGGDINAMRRKIYDQNKDIHSVDLNHIRNIVPNTRKGSLFENTIIHRKTGNLTPEEYLFEKQKEEWWNKKFKDVSQEYYNNATPGIGIKNMDPRMSEKKQSDEKSIRDLLHSVFGGNIRCLNKDLYAGESPDYIWNKALWELKTPNSGNNLNKLAEKGLIQINTPLIKYPPGGIVFDLSNINIGITESIDIILRRFSMRSPNDADIIIIKDEEIIKVIRYKKG